MAHERPLLAAAALRVPAADRAGRRRRHPAHRRRPALGPRHRPDRDPGDDRGPPRARPRGAARRRSPGTATARRGRRSPATSSPPSSGSSPGPSSGGCSARSRPASSPARSTTARRRGRRSPAARCRIGCRRSRDARLHLLRDRRRRRAGRDRRLRRAHGRLHGHQPGDPGPRAGGPARPLGRPARDLRRRTSSGRCWPRAALARGCSEALEPGRLQHPQLLRRRRLADGLPLPPARHPALRRRSAEAALGPARRGRRGRDRARPRRGSEARAS